LVAAEGKVITAREIFFDPVLGKNSGGMKAGGAGFTSGALMMFPGAMENIRFL
jgi:hypothetical protein